MATENFISLGMALPGGGRLTISADSVGTLQGYLNDLNEIDETDPEGMSAINYILDGVVAVNAAVQLKMPIQAAPTGNRPAPAPSTTPQPGGSAPMCEKHNAPMIWEPDGLVRNGTNAGKRYSAWKCAMPYQPGVKCGFKDFTIKG